MRRKFSGTPDGAIKQGKALLYLHFGTKIGRNTESCRKSLTNPSKKVIYKCIGCTNLVNIFLRRI